LLSLDLSSQDDHPSGASLLRRQVVAYDRDGVPIAYGARRDGEIWIEVPDVASFHLPAAGASLMAVPAERVDSDAVLDAYYGTALPLAVQATRGLEILHGSAVLVASQGSVVAFCGISGSGKSTVGHGLAARGHDHWADDAVAFQANGRPPSTLGLPFATRHRASEPALRVVEDFAWKSAKLQAVFLLERVDAGRSNSAAAIERLSPEHALHALLPHAYRFHPQAAGRARETVRSYLELAASVPILRVRFAHRRDRLPQLLDELERRLNDVG
jgi:hypothetical protein